MTSDKLKELQYEIVNLVTKNTDLEDALVTITGAMEQQKKVASAAKLPPLIDNKLDMKKLFVAFLVKQKPAETPSAPSTSIIEKKLQEVFDGIKGTTRNVCRSQKPC